MALESVVKHAKKKAATFMSVIMSVKSGPVQKVDIKYHRSKNLQRGDQFRRLISIIIGVTETKLAVSKGFHGPPATLYPGIVGMLAGTCQHGRRN